MSGRIAKGLGRLLGTLLPGMMIERPAPRPIRMVPGGANAPQLCMLPTDTDPAAPMAGHWQLKADGMRALKIGDGIVSREGVPLDCALHCLPALQQLEKSFGRPMVIDGEYLEEEGFDATMRAYRSGKGTGVFWIIDAVPYDEWLVDRCRQPIEERFAAINRHLESVQSPFVGFLTPFWLPNAIDVEAKVREVWALGYEGMVGKKAGSRYRRDKSADWQRWKETITIDCAVMDVLAKDGTLRAIMVKGPSGPLKISTGISASTGADIKAAFNAGRELVVEIAYNRKAGSSAPRHARLVRVRHDKKEGIVK